MRTRIRVFCQMGRISDNRSVVGTQTKFFRRCRLAWRISTTTPTLTTVNLKTCLLSSERQNPSLLCWKRENLIKNSKNYAIRFPYLQNDHSLDPGTGFSWNIVYYWNDSRTISLHYIIKMKKTNRNRNRRRESGTGRTTLTKNTRWLTNQTTIPQSPTRYYVDWGFTLPLQSPWRTINRWPLRDTSRPVDLTDDYESTYNTQNAPLFSSLKTKITHGNGG
jgi:hypothetical protein